MRKWSFCALLIIAAVCIGYYSFRKTSFTAQSAGPATFHMNELGTALDAYDRTREEKAVMYQKCEKLQKNSLPRPTVFTDQAAFDGYLHSENKLSACWAAHNTLPNASDRTILAALPYDYTWFVVTARGSHVAVAKAKESYCTTEYTNIADSRLSKNVSWQNDVLVVAPWNGNENNLPPLKQPEELNCGGGW